MTTTDAYDIAVPKGEIRQEESQGSIIHIIRLGLSYRVRKDSEKQVMTTLIEGANHGLIFLQGAEFIHVITSLLMT